ncbi:hypothetical protein MKX03_006859, partial [Papaver bracteatum]
MVVLAASIVSKSGKVLVSRKFVNMNRIRIEGLLDAFLKLVGIGKQHTFVEIENVRYVYQTMDALYLLLVTNTQSNIVEDLETQRLLSKSYPFWPAYKLLLFHRLNNTVRWKVMKKTCISYLRKSKIDNTKDVMKCKASEVDKSKGHGASREFGSMQSISSRIESIIMNFSLVPPPTDSIILNIKEKLNVLLKREGGVSNFDVQGTITLQALNQENGLIQAQTHPNINENLFSNKNILGLKDPNTPFQTYPHGYAGVNLLRWRMLITDECLVPLTNDNFFFYYVLLNYIVFAVKCCPHVCGGDSYVSMEYKESKIFNFHNLVISVPLTSHRDTLNVNLVDGDW